MGGSMPADPEPNEREPNEPEPNEPEPNKLETAADDAIDSALVGIMTGAAEGTAGAKPAEGAAASCAAEAGAVLLLDGSRQHLRAALDHARMGNIKDARFQLVEASPQLLCLLH